MGFLILNVILGGQALASASSGGLSWTVGIVIISLIALFVSINSAKSFDVYQPISHWPCFLRFSDHILWLPRPHHL